MNLGKKKQLAARALDVGVNRIGFNTYRLAELKEAITKQDMRDLAQQGVIFVKQTSGRKSVEKRGRRRAGSIRKKVSPGKKHYMRTVRNLRSSVAVLRKQGALTPEQFKKLRQEIRAGAIKTRTHLTERITLLKQ